jgi:hypothetical protein
MDVPAWEKLISRRSWLLAGLTVAVSRAFQEQPLQVRYDPDNLRVYAPGLHFLSGKALDRLKDGDAVAFLASLELLDESKSTSLRSARGRFVVSYALWEERFSVTELAGKQLTVDGLSALSAESWCFDKLALNTNGVPPDRYFWLRFEIHTASARDVAAEGVPGLSFAKLIAWLGKKNTEQTQWGPLERRVRLADLPRTPGRGSRG